MRQSDKAIDALLDDLQNWPIDSISDEYFLMLTKSMVT